MAYERTTLVSRRGYDSVDGTWDDIKQGVKGAVSSAVSFYGSAQQAQGAAAALQQQNAQMTAALAAQQRPPSSGIDTKTIALLGAAGLGLVLILRKK